MRKIGIILCIGIVFSILPSYGQQSFGSLFNEIVIKVDSSQYSYSKNHIKYQGQNYLYFYFNSEDEVCELNLFPAFDSKITSVELLKSSDYVQLDSIVFLNRDHYKIRVKFLNLNKSNFLNFTFNIRTEGSDKNKAEELKLFPFTKTTVNFFPPSDELFIGEEKVYELVTNNLNNIKLTSEWTTGLDINYRISESNGQLRIHLLPSALGARLVKIKFQTISPFLNENKELTYDLPVLEQSFRVKNSRIVFLNLDKKDITYDEDARKTGILVQLDNHRQIVIGKTYRIENQEQPGGALIAELFTKNNLANDKILCILRPFNLHRQTEGYLYIKDGDETKFITNISFTPKTNITSVQVMHEGQDWTQNLAVYPGETVDIKLEGEGLHKAKFHWEDVIDITSDTLIRNETLCYFKLKVPMTINKRQVTLFNNVTPTGFSLKIKEYQTPRNLDFVMLNYGSGKRVLSNLNPTVIQRNTIKDITIGFDNIKIDSDNKLFGKQYLDVEVKILGKRGELIEMKSIKNLVVCPGDNSPRAAYYKDKACTNSNISLNTILGNKTFDMEDFSQIQMEFKHQGDKYSDGGFTKQVDIVLQRMVMFDIDVSFPAGLLIQNLGKTNTERTAFAIYDEQMSNYPTEHGAYLKQLEQWTANPVGAKPVFQDPVKPKKATFTDDIGGISLALIAQFSFPDAEKVGRMKPYKLGAGFLAINTFNFNQSAQRDLAVVFLGSLYPIKPGRVFSMPIHFGFGYKFQDAIPFLMLSPGIGIRF